GGDVGIEGELAVAVERRVEAAVGQQAHEDGLEAAAVPGAAGDHDAAQVVEGDRRRLRGAVGGEIEGDQPLAGAPEIGVEASGAGQAGDAELVGVVGALHGGGDHHAAVAVERLPHAVVVVVGAEVPADGGEAVARPGGVEHAVVVHAADQAVVPGARCARLV